MKSPSRIQRQLEKLSRSLDLLWISTCHSADIFDKWGPGDGLIIIENSDLNDASWWKWKAVHGDISQREVGFFEVTSIGNAFTFADQAETNHDLEIEDVLCIERL